MPGLGAIASVPHRTLNLTLAVLLLMAAVTITASVGLDVWQSAERLDTLRQGLETALANQARAAQKRGDDPATPKAAGSVARLMAADKASAAALIQRTLQGIVVPPARIETLQTLDIPGDPKTTSIHAAFRIRGLAPDAVVDLVRQLDRTTPAIVFDDLRVSIRTRAGPIAATGSKPSPEVRDAELTGIVRVFVAPSANSLPSPPGDSGP